MQNLNVDVKRETYEFHKEVLLPRTWTITQLSDLCEILDGQRIPIEESERKKRKGMYPYYGASGIIDYVDGFIFNERLLCLAEDGENLRSRVLPVAFTIDGKTWVNNHAHVLRPKKEKTDHQYLEYFLNYKLFDNYLSFTAQPKLTQEAMRKIRIILPNIGEQQKIASTLSKVDELIQKTDQLIEQTQRLKKGLMQRLLIKGIGHTKFKKTVIGEIPEEWHVDMLGKFVKIIAGEYFAYSEFVESGIRVLKIDNVMYGKIDWENRTFLPPEYVQSHNELVLKKGDVVLALNRPITNNELKVARLTQLDIPCILYQRVGKIDINEGVTVDHDFLYTFFNSEFFKKIINRILIGSDQPYVKTTELLRQRVSIPSDIEEQREIAKITFQTDKLINVMANEGTRLRIVKKGLMQKLLTGKIRIKA